MDQVKIAGASRRSGRTWQWLLRVVGTCDPGPVEVLTSSQHRALAFIASANAGGYSPTADQVQVWLSSPEHRERWSALMGLGTLTASARALYGMGFLSVAEHMEYLGWVQGGSAGLSMTPLGTALLRSADQASSDAASVVVLDPDDEVAYATLIGELSGAGDALLIDPYLGVQGFVDVRDRTAIRRVLISDKQGARKNRATIATLLAGTPDNDMDVRVSTGLHDRLVVGGDGDVWTIGASLNTVSRRTAMTTISPLPETAARAVAQEVQTLWEDAEPLVPDTPALPAEGTDGPP